VKAKRLAAGSRRMSDPRTWTGDWQTMQQGSVMAMSLRRLTGAICRRPSVSSSYTMLTTKIASFEIMTAACRCGCQFVRQRRVES